jgi:hypothetical protein
MAPLVKEASVQKDNGLSPWPKKDSVSENFSKAPLSNNPPEGLPVSNPKLIEGLSPSASSCNGDVPNFGSTAKGKIDDYNEKGKLKKDLRVSVAMSPSFNDAQSSSTAKNVTDETSHKVRWCLPFSLLLIKKVDGVLLRVLFSLWMGFHLVSY